MRNRNQASISRRPEMSPTENPQPSRSNRMFVQLLKEYPGKSIGERIDVSEADAEQLIRQGWAQPVHDDLLTPTIARAVQGGLDDAVDRALQKFLQSHGGAKQHSRLPFAGLGDSAHDDPRAGFKHFGEFAL